MLRGHTASVNALAVVPQHVRQVTGAADGTIRWRDMAKAGSPRDRSAHEGDVYGYAFSPDGRLAVAPMDSSISLLEARRD